MLGGGFHFHHSPWKAKDGLLGLPADTHLAPLLGDRIVAREGVPSLGMDRPIAKSLYKASGKGRCCDAIRSVLRRIGQR